MNTDQAKSSKVRMSSVFANEEQESLFAECAKRAMSTDSRLSWDNEEVSEKMSGEVRLVSPFANKEQEKFFAECSQASMNPNSRLKW